jgi:type IV pilus assembly protein PilC
MLFSYTVINQSGVEQEGSLEAPSEDAAIARLQKNGYVIVALKSSEKKSLFSSGGSIQLFERVSTKEVVILSRQIATLFEAQVSALRVFKLLGTESSNPLLQRSLLQIADDIQGGMSISHALGKHPRIFSSFYCNMVLAGEETGRLRESFENLATYIDRSYAITSKAQHALVYPSFIIATFVGVMALMLTFVIPKLTDIIKDSGVEIPIYTRIVMGVSDVFKNYGLVLFVVLAGVVVALLRYGKTSSGRDYFDRIKIDFPAIGKLYRKLYLTRISQTLSAMLESGISMVQALEITSAVVENVHFERALLTVRDDIKNGSSISKAFGAHEEIPTIMVQMMHVGEETGELGKILQTLGHFYAREVEQAVDTLVGLIEPLMIILLAGGVGTLLASVLLPIYSISTSIK